ncbi:MAG: hypothetical protein HY232_15135 [Acidobacteria bacterium]|nr:hypothetical protein [Acidobacteriota bacterium]
MMKRGMAGEKNVEFLGKEDRRYIIGAPRGQLTRYEKELLQKDWQRVHEGLEVKVVAA